MLFKTRFLPGIRSGAIPLTFRAWDRARVKVGTRPRCAGIGRLEVEAVDEVALATLSAREATAAGFASLDELVAMLQDSSSKRLTGRSKVWRVRFRFLGADMPPAAADTSAAASFKADVRKLEALGLA